jgi:O-antigen/teichoic acid export membrane protein
MAEPQGGEPARRSWFPKASAAAAEGPTHASGMARLVVGGALNYGLGQSLPMVLGLLLVPLYTAVLTPGDYGIVEMMTVIGAVLGVFARMGVPGAITRHYYEHAEGPALRDYVTSIAWFLRITGIVVGGLALIAGFFFVDDLAEGLRFFPYVPLMVLATMLAANSEVQRRLIQVRRQSAYSARLSIVYSLVGIGLTVVFVLGFRLGATGILLAHAITAVIFLVNATLYLRPDLQGTVRGESIREAVSYGRGIFTSHLVAASGPLISRSVLAGAESLGAVGLFSLATRVTSPLTIVSQAFGTAYSPEYFAARKNGGEAARVALSKFEAGIWTLAILGTVGVALLGPPAIVLLTPDRFHKAAALVPILAVGFLGQVLYALASPEMFYVKRKWLPAIVTSSNIGTTIVLSLLLVGRYGAAGIAWASVAGTIMGGVVCALVAARGAPLTHDWGAMARALAVGMAGIGIGGFVTLAPQWRIPMAFAILAGMSLALFAMGDPAMRRIALEIRTRTARLRRSPSQGES